MIRVGLGYDVHRFTDRRRLVLGGVEIAHDAGLEGHSDADVVLHAVTDALLGATGNGDIGTHFPPDDDAWRDADSGELLRRACGIIGDGWQVENLDIVVVAEAPKIGPHRAEMSERISRLIGIAPGAVNIKATTNEGMGFVGRGEGIAALATALLSSREG